MVEWLIDARNATMTATKIHRFQARKHSRWWWTNQGEAPPSGDANRGSCNGSHLAQNNATVDMVIGEAPVGRDMRCNSVWSANPLRAISERWIITDCFCFVQPCACCYLFVLSRPWEIVDFYVGYQNYAFNTRIRDLSMLASCGLSIITVSLAIPLIVGSCCLHHTVGPNVSL